MPILKAVWDLKQKVIAFFKGLGTPKKSVEQLRAEGEAAITRQEAGEAVQVRCIAGKSAFTIQLVAQQDYEIHEQPQVASTLEGIRILSHTPGRVTMGYLFTERTKATGRALLTILWSARKPGAEAQQGTVTIDFEVADGGKPNLLSLESKVS